MVRAEHHVHVFRALVGAMMAVGGGVAVVFLTLIANATTPGLDRVAFTLGLAGLPLLSGMAQVVMLIGAAMVWAQLRHR